MTTIDNKPAALPSGFAGSYDDYIDQPLNLHDLLVTHPAATFFFRITGDELATQGIHDGEIAVVDRSLTARPLDWVLTISEGEFIAQEWQASVHQPITADDGTGTNNEKEVIGVITSIIHQFRRG
jgi:DNA polymerase V